MTRYAAALGAAVIATLLIFSTTALAFTVRNAGFTATAYATGYVADAGGHGPRASAWDGNVLWAVDAADGGLYRADAGAAGPGPLTSLTATRVNSGAIAGGLNGLASGLDGRLYATLTSSEKVVELSKTDGAILRELSTASSLRCPASVATDPLSGDLLVTTCSGLWRIAAPATAPLVTRYARIADQDIAMSAIAIGPDGTIFVMSAFGIYTIGSTAQATPLVAPMSSLVADVTGIAVVTADSSTVPQWLFVSTAAGSVYKIPGVGISSPSIYLVLDGAGSGDQLSVGPDRCVYASMGATILRVADAAGTCALAAAGVQVPRLSLANTTGQAAHVNGAFQTIAAELTGAAIPGGHRVTFTVTGANPGVFSGTTSAGGVATMSYQGRVVGTDTIVATTTIDGVTVTSPPLALVWLPEIDLAPPTISFTYSVPAGGTGVGFNCPAETSGTASIVFCGWFTQAPTIQWNVTANGTSGLGALTNCQDYTLDYQPSAEGHHQICYAQNGDGAGASLTVVINAILAPPTITASATTSGGAPYLAGTATAGPVVVRFSCTSPISAGLVCPADLMFDAPGSFVATGEAVDIAGQRTSATFGPIVIDRQATALAITSSAFVASGAPVSARLVTASGAPIADATVTIAAGGVTGSGVTDATGVARVTLALAPGVYTLTATYAGSAQYFPSSASATGVTVYAMTHFAVWAPNATPGATVQFYGSDWSKQISDRDARRGFSDFKGYAERVFDAYWTARTGDAVKPPATIPQYIGVILTTGASKTGDTIRGDVVGVAVVRVDPPGKRTYDGRLGDRGYGVVLSVTTAR